MVFGLGSRSANYSQSEANSSVWNQRLGLCPKSYTTFVKQHHLNSGLGEPPRSKTNLEVGMAHQEGEECWVIWMGNVPPWSRCWNTCPSPKLVFGEVIETLESRVSDEEGHWGSVWVIIVCLPCSPTTTSCFCYPTPAMPMPMVPHHAFPATMDYSPIMIHKKYLLPWFWLVFWHSNEKSN